MDGFYLYRTPPGRRRLLRAGGSSRTADQLHSEERINSERELNRKSKLVRPRKQQWRHRHASHRRQS